MVAKITEPKDIHRPIYYNENKVAEGVAKFLDAGGFLKMPEHLTLQDKLQRFDRLHALNKSEYKTLHISLNFDPSEKLSADKLREIAAEYIGRIGFAEHPYLLYEHHDAGHPHVHIVLTAIREDGSRKDFHKIGEKQSEEARKAIEIKYKLVKAEEQNKRAGDTLKPLNVQKLQYGKSESKRGITNVLDAVIDKYKYASLAELNAILSLYNVRADPGETGGRIQRHKGLLYRMVDGQGKPVGVPVKASAIYSKPTLARLEQKFAKAAKTAAEIKRVKTAIDWILAGQPKNLAAFIEDLRKEQVRVVAYRNKEGMVYGMSYVDTNNKAVFKASDIGKAYSAKNILARLEYDQQLNRFKPDNNEQLTNLNRGLGLISQPVGSEPVPSSKDSLVEILLRSEDEHESTPYELRADKKKKQKPSNNF